MNNLCIKNVFLPFLSILLDIIKYIRYIIIIQLLYLWISVKKKFYWCSSPRKFESDSILTISNADLNEFRFKNSFKRMFLPRLQYIKVINLVKDLLMMLLMMQFLEKIKSSSTSGLIKWINFEHYGIITLRSSKRNNQTAF